MHTSPPRLLSLHPSHPDPPSPGFQTWRRHQLWPSPRGVFTLRGRCRSCSQLSRATEFGRNKEVRADLTGRASSGAGRAHRAVWNVPNSHRDRGAGLPLCAQIQTRRAPGEAGGASFLRAVGGGGSAPKPNKEQERNGTEGCGSAPQRPPPAEFFLSPPRALATADKGSCGALSSFQATPGLLAPFSDSPASVCFSAVDAVAGARPCAPPPLRWSRGAPGQHLSSGVPGAAGGVPGALTWSHACGEGEAYACLPSLGLKSQGGLFLK